MDFLIGVLYISVTACFIYLVIGCLRHNEDENEEYLEEE